MSYTFVTKSESGDRRLDVMELIRLADLYGKPPEFFQDWRFLFVGLRWWFAKMAGKA